MLIPKEKYYNKPVANCDLEELVVGTKVTFCDLEGLSPLSKVTISLSC